MTFRFRRTVRVRYYETDRQGHVNFIWHTAYFALALADYLKAIGYSYQKLNDEGFDMLYVDAHASFHGPSYYDELLSVACRAERVGNTSIRFRFETTADGGARRVARGDITVVIVDRESREKTRVPDAFRRAVEAYAPSENET